MENNEIIRLQEDLKYWENAFLRLQEQHRVIQKLFYELRGKQEGRNIEARCYHLDCLELTEYGMGKELTIAQQFKKKVK